MRVKSISTEDHQNNIKRGGQEVIHNISSLIASGRCSSSSGSPSPEKSLRKAQNTLYSQNIVTMHTTNNLMYTTPMQEQKDLNIATTSFPATGASEISCLIDAQLTFIAAATAGGVILILLTSTIVLACTVSSLKRRQRAPRPSQSNAELVSGTGNWGTERREGSTADPCETSVLLEDVKTDGKEEEIHDGITTSNATSDSETVSPQPCRAPPQEIPA